jgi:hypothetical protein
MHWQGKRLSAWTSTLWFIDAQGIALLRDLAGKRVTQVNCSQFISQQLEETAL